MGIKNAPTRVAKVADNSSQRKSLSRACETPWERFSSIRLARNGP